LFFLRVKAVFHGNSYVIASFFTLWLAVLGACLIVPFGAHGVHIGDTGYCTEADVKPWAAVATVMNMCYGTLVFLATSWKLVYSDENTSKSKAFFTGKGFSNVSTKILQSGLLYYSYVS
jgi:hypothetical protein